MRTTEQTGKRKNNADLPESNDDIKHLQPDEATLDLPDVKDIPGQEHIRPIIAGEISDTTISSADEEGEGILDTDEDDLLQGSAFNVTKTEKQLLKQSSESMETEENK